MLLTDRLDLRGGRACWRESTPEFASDVIRAEVDVVVIGAGIMGAMVAERLSRDGLAVTVLDRRPPASGATGGSTALVMWGADTPLLHLARQVGEDRAAQTWRRVFQAIETLDQRITELNIECGWRARPEIYLDGDVLGPEDLASEGAARRAAGLPSEFIRANDLGARFKITPRDGLLSKGSYEVDPVALTKELLRGARSRGAHVSFPVDVDRLAQDGRCIRLFCADNVEILARHVVIASGYEPARLFLPAHFSLSSSYAIASRPGQAPAWAENALIWEASDPYLYARATNDGRIIIGGEDEDFVDPDRRDALIPQKRATLEAKAARLLGRDELEFECAWSATFGGSPDGLPAIGPARNLDNLTLAYGFGGNGVTFASLGADIVSAIVRGVPDYNASWFDPYRPVRDD